MEGDNIVCYNSLELEGSFLVGALAALMKQDAATYGLTDTKELGFVGALETDLIVRFAAGYKVGAQYIDPAINVTVSVCWRQQSLWRYGYRPGDRAQPARQRL